MDTLSWSKSEKQIAQQAFNQAYKRECEALIQQIQEKFPKIVEPETLWELHDLLSNKRKEINEKYDYRYSIIIFVFARLIKEGWLDLSELQGLGKDKLSQINVLLNM